MAAAAAAAATAATAESDTGGAGCALESEWEVPTRCHCANCKKFTGTAFSTNILFPEASVAITKGSQFHNVYIDAAQSSGIALYRHFCARCSSPLFISRSPDGAKVTNAEASTQTGVLDPSLSKKEKAMVSAFYSALDDCADVVQPEDINGHVERVAKVPVIEFHVRDRLAWVEELKEAKQVYTSTTKPGRED
ncbi:hypothetical protein EW145_g5410 [Phellinidium pouzarii]|uniref:CENP-V/GFA domain-containing protein n=1 Tax=Phellinidium pouzarii TaxID=167371 RepID=A0A4S4L0L4_9AGAM|nr:hypothetical protein EW145_g5410 [Phellinidium pouzarii]